MVSFIRNTNSTNAHIIIAILILNFVQAKYKLDDKDVALKKIRLEGEDEGIPSTRLDQINHLK